MLAQGGVKSRRERDGAGLFLHLGKKGPTKNGLIKQPL